MQDKFDTYKEAILSLTGLEYIPESAFVEAWENQESPEEASLWIKEVYSEINS